MDLQQRMREAIRENVMIDPLDRDKIVMTVEAGIACADIAKADVAAFADWILKGNFIMCHDVEDWWEGHNKTYTSEQLYSLFQQSL